LAYLLDTSVAIHLRDRTAGLRERFLALGSRPFLSSVSRVELEGGVHAVPELTRLRRDKLDIVLDTLEVIDFTDAMAATYGEIVASLGFNRRKIIDRMIAATAIVGDLTLITSNGADFEEIGRLDLEVWTL
jgi:tRNA(fMet)-specific endonuclease VapC